MITVRSIIVEALNRSNLVSRRQSAPADMVESAYRLLKGIAGKYSNDNLLQFLGRQRGFALFLNQGGNPGGHGYLVVSSLHDDAVPLRVKKDIRKDGQYRAAADAAHNFAQCVV